MTDNKNIIDVDKALEEKEEVDNRSTFVRIMDKIIAIVVIGAIFVAVILGVDKIMEWVRAVVWGV